MPDNPRTQGSSRSAARPSQTPVLLGALFLLLGIGGLIFLRCPAAGQSYALVISIIIGASVLIFAFTGVFHLSGPVRGITSAGAGTVFLLLFFFVPGAMERIQCSSDHALHFRVCEEAGCPAEAIAEAMVSVLRLGTASLEMDANGEGAYRYDDPAVGQIVQIWASADGFTRSAVIRHALPQDPTSRLLIPLARIGTASNTVALPAFAVGDVWPSVKEIDLAHVADLTSNPTGRENDLAAAGTAAFARGNFDATVKLLEPLQRAAAGGGVSGTAPYLAAAYYKLGRAQQAEELLAEARPEAPATSADEATEAKRKFLAENAKEAAAVAGDQPALTTFRAEAAAKAAVRPIVNP